MAEPGRSTEANAPPEARGRRRMNPSVEGLAAEGVANTASGLCLADQGAIDGCGGGDGGGDQQGDDQFAEHGFLLGDFERKWLSTKAMANRSALATGLCREIFREGSHHLVRAIETPWLEIAYEPYAFEPIRPKQSRPAGASVAPWPEDEALRPLFQWR